MEKAEGTDAMIMQCNGTDAGMEEEGGFKLQTTNPFVWAVGADMNSSLILYCWKFD